MDEPAGLRRAAARRGARWWAVQAALLVAPLAFLGVFLAWPVVSIVGRGLWPDDRLDLSPLGDLVADERLRRVAWFTVWQAAASTALTLVVALPGAYVLSRYAFRGRALVRSLVTVPFVLPTIVVAAAFLALGAEPSVWTVLVAHAFFNYAVVVRTVGGLWAHLDPRLDEAARVLGASPWRAFREVTLPLLRPALVAAGSIVFLFCFSSFGVVLLLGGARRSTIEVEIYRQTAQLLDLPVAAALATAQFVVVFALLVVYGRAQSRWAVAQKLRRSSETLVPVRGLRRRLLAGGTLASMALLLGAPVAMLVARSFRSGTGDWTLVNWRALGDTGTGLAVRPLDAIATSVQYAAVATVLALAVGLPAAVALVRARAGGMLDAAFMLPLGTSAVTIGFGFLIALDSPPLDLRTSWVLVPIAQAVVALPFVIRAVTPVARSIDPRLREAAAVLGASPWWVWREVDLPLVRRAVLVAAGFAFAVSLGEFGATIFIARPSRPTLPVAIFRLLGRPGALNYGRAMALAVVLMAVTAVAVAALERVRPKALGEF